MILITAKTHWQYGHTKVDLYQKNLNFHTCFLMNRVIQVVFHSSIEHLIDIWLFFTLTINWIANMSQ